MNELLVALLSGAATGLVTWGGMRIEIRYMRRDVDRAHWRLDQLPCGGQYRRSTDCQGGTHVEA